MTHVRFGDEGSLADAAALGRRMASVAVTSADIAAIHEYGIERLAEACPHSTLPEIAARLSRPLVQVLTAHARAALRRTERHDRTVAALRASERNLAKGLAMAHLGIWGRDLRTQRVTWSDEQFRIFGREPGAFEPTYRKLVAAIHPDDRARVIAAGRASIEDAAPYDLEFRIVRPDGEVRVVHSRGEVIRDPNGVPERKVGTVLDITDRVRSEAALQASEARFKAVVDHAPTAIYLKDTEGRYLLVNRKFEAWYGIKAADVVGGTAHDCFSRPAADHSAAQDRQVLESRRAAVREMTVTHPDGSRHATVIVKFPVFDAQGKVVAIGGVNTDIAELRRTEAALRESEQRFRAIIDHLPNVTYLKDTAGRYLLVNKQWEAWHGVAAADVIGRAAREFLPAELADETAAQDRLTLETRRVTVREASFAHADGSPRTMIITKFPMFDADGNLVAIGGVSTDITDRKQAEEELKESEQRYRLLVDRMQDGLYLVQDERVVFANEALVRLLGYRVDDLVGREVWDVIAPESRDMVRDFYFRRQADEEVPVVYDCAWLRKDGVTRIPVTLNVGITETEDGRRATIGTVKDITARKRAEEALRESEERFRVALDSTVVGSVVIDESGGVDIFNAAAADIFGYDAGEVIGRNVGMLMPESGRSEYDRYFAEYLETGKKIVGADWEVRGLRKNGEEFPMQLAVGEMRVGERRMFIASITDLSEVKRLESQLAHAQKLEALGQLTGGIAHDFNNLLAVILLNGEVLDGKGVLGPEANELLQAMIVAAARSAELTNQLLAFGRQQPLSPRAADLGELCAGMTKLLRRTLGEAIEIEMRTELGLWNALADPGQVESALLNLAINARDAMPAGGKLTIEAECARLAAADMDGHADGRPGDYVVLKVSDTGAGMPAHVLEHVFEPYFTTKDVGRGSGLGLSMVYGFAKQSGGHVAIESEEGRGTTVSLYLPRAPATAPALPEAGMAPESHGRGETVLVVEDDPDLRSFVCKILRTLDYDVLTAEDGRAAMDILAAAEVDILLADVVLPGGVSGIDVYDRVRKAHPDLKCLLMSGHAGAANAPLPDGVGMLRKPFRIAEIARGLRAALDA